MGKKLTAIMLAFLLIFSMLLFTGCRNDGANGSVDRTPFTTGDDVPENTTGNNKAGNNMTGNNTAKNNMTRNNADEDNLKHSTTGINGINGTVNPNGTAGNTITGR